MKDLLRHEQLTVRGVCTAQGRTSGYVMENTTTMALFRHHPHSTVNKRRKVYRTSVSVSILNASVAATVAGCSGIPCTIIALVLAVDAAFAATKHNQTKRHRPSETEHFA